MMMVAMMMMESTWMMACQRWLVVGVGWQRQTALKQSL
jgi:hypothetical protein